MTSFQDIGWFMKGSDLYKLLYKNGSLMDWIYWISTVYLSSSISSKSCVVPVSLIKDEISLASPKYSPWYICLMWTESLRGKQQPPGVGRGHFTVLILCLSITLLLVSGSVLSPCSLTSFAVCLLSLGMMYRCLYHSFFPERPQPCDLHPKNSHSPAPSSFVHCLCHHGSLSPIPATWFYPSSPFFMKFHPFLTCL